MMARCISIIIIFGILLFPFAGKGQEIVRKERKFFKLPEKATAHDYHHGIINIKVKPEFREAFRNPQNLEPGVLDVFEMLGIESFKPIIPVTSQLKVNARLRAKPTYDIRLYHRLQYSGNMPVEDAINLLFTTGIVEIAEPEYIQKLDFVPDDSLLNRQYHLDLIKAFDAWDVTTGDTTVIIAIVDSGIDVDHPDLAGNLWVNPNDPVDGIDNDGNGFVDDIHGWDFGGAIAGVNDEDNDPDITKGGSHQHGLSVAGVAGSTANNGKGFAGTGYHCRLMITKHFADNQPENAISYDSNPYIGIIYAAENGADVINCSWGSTFRSAFNQDLINYVTLDLGVLVVASSGNSGLEESHYPSDYNNVLSVSAVDKSLKKSSFTTYGKGVDITAPGSAIAVLEYDGGYGVTQGTSFSSPMVAGAAGLVKSMYPEFDGVQVGELLRVTANDTIYDVNPSSSFRNKLGKGMLDMHRALTTQPPAIRMLSYRLSAADGKSPEPGEEAYFIANFKNFLWPSSSGLIVKLTSKSALLEVMDETSHLGTLNMGQTVTNSAQPFRIRIWENIPTNVKIDLILEYEDGEYTDYQFLSILLNPTFLNIEENQIASSIAENGRIGYQDTDQSQGLGFIFDEQNTLFEMGLMLGNSESQISSAVRSILNIDNKTTYDEDFVSTQRIADFSPGDFSAAEITGAFNDMNAGDSASNVSVRFRTMVWKEAPDDKYFIVEYTIRNDGDSTLNSFHTGLYADWDISDNIHEGNGSGDRADWYDSLSLGYVYNTDTSEQYYNGIQVLTGSSNYWAIDNNDAIPDNPWGVYDGFEDEEKYESMSRGIGRRQAGISDEDGNDVSHTVAAGPYAIAPGDSIVVAFAIHGASTYDDLLSSALSADTMYNLTLKETTPVLADVDICYGDSATIMASGATAYKWYKTKTGGEPFFEGEAYITENLFNDTVFYVSNAGNPWESVRTPVNLFAKANPSIILSGSQVLCDGDTTTLMVAEADTYLWKPFNETTNSIQVTETGMYSVTVTYDSLGCISTSDDISIIKYNPPSASFTLDKHEIEKNVDTEINMTDQSNNSHSWFWRLSDGQTSTEQNPTFTVNTLHPIEVILTVTSQEGCQDQDTQVIDVITGLDDQIDLGNNLRIYPNPASGALSLELITDYPGPYQIKLYNTTGRLVKDLAFLKTGETAVETLDLTGLPVGLYLLHVVQGSFVNTTVRILVK